MRTGLSLSVALLACAAVARAHQPYESSTVVRLDHEHLEVAVITSIEIAGMLVGKPAINATALDHLHPQLTRAGGELYDLTLSGKFLPPERVFFNLRGGEAVFSVIYPVAAGGGAKLRFRAVYLDKLPPGYGGSIEVFDDTGHLLGHQPLLRKGDAKDTFSVQLPANASTSLGPPDYTPTPANGTMQGLSGGVASGQPGIAPKTHEPLLFIAGFCAALSVVAGVVWRFQRFSS